MAEIEIGPLTDRLSDDEIMELARAMEKLGAPQLPRSDETQASPVGDNIDDDALSEFYDRLEVHDLAAEIYLPVEFDGSVEVAGMRVASASVLVDVLEEIKDELDIDEDEDEEEDDEADFDDDRRILEAQLKQVWKLFYTGAQAAVERRLPLHVKT
ncbi:MAG TPA: hypothetical protein VFF06_18020 [Polyangia bacterium]|nr:hypothetical protein [Polyangia bacterium]